MGAAWDRVVQIFEAALDQPASVRAAFLDRQCNGDAGLRREVESLLAHDDAGNTYLESAVAAAAETAQGLHTGERIGGYEIVREIGRGGMGAVYLAVRADDTFRKQVALKIVKRGMDSDFVLARFRQERQILAGLEHPSIARLYDGGTTADGRPFLVMEYVEGISVSAYCKEQNLPLPERLSLFVQVCGAVEAAHRRLIVHRDLKPTNILVNANREVKLLDFGIAKLLNEDLSETAALTQTTMRLLTPEYASPEQVSQAPITTSTDIYALGLVLYEMLTGERAHKIRDLSPGAWEQWVLETEPAKPSSIAGPFPSQLQGDLDNIIGKALRKEPERRYLTVQEFRDDIERFLKDEPISARRDTISYRAGKFVRRHRVPVIAAALVAVSLIAGAAVAIQQARIAQENAARAERRFAQVRTLAKTLLFDLDAKIQNLPGSAPARESLVKTSLEYLDSLSKESSGDPTLQAELAEAYLRVANIQGGQYKANLGRTPEAEQSLKKAVALQQALVAANPNDTNHSLALARTLLAVSDMDEKRGGSATGSLDEAILRVEAANKTSPNNATIQKMLAEAYSHAYGRYLNRNLPRALDSAIRSLTAAEEAERLEAGKHLVALYGARLRAGRTYLRQGDPVKARTTLQLSLNTLQQILATDPLNTKMNRERAFSRQQLSRALASPLNAAGPDLKAAAARIDEAIDIVRALEKTDEGNVLRFFDVCAMETEAIVLQSELDPRRALQHEARARQYIDTYLKLEPNHAYAKTVPVEIDLEVSRAHVRLNNWREVDRLMTNVLTARAKRPALRNVEFFSRRARARALLARPTEAAADADIATKALTQAPLKEIEVRDIFNIAASWADIAATRRALAQSDLAAAALSRRKDVFAEIRSRGFRSSYIDKLEAQP